MSEEDKGSSNSSSKWDYNAPRYVDFRGILDEVDTNVEDYFNYDHEANKDFEETENLNPTTVPAAPDSQVSVCPDEAESDKENTAMRDEESDIVHSPSRHRGRSRMVLSVNDERKRLSLSVDRGLNKLNARNKSPEKACQATTSSQQDARATQVVTSDQEPPSASTSSPNVNETTATRDDNEKVEDPIETITEQLQNEVQQIVPKVVPHVGVPFKWPSGVKLTHVQPFSFEKRDQEMASKRERLIKKVLEDEKKARQFKAQPFPEIIYSSQPSKVATAGNRRSKMNAPLPSGSGARARPTSTNQPNQSTSQPMFKARPATVLLKDPFKPVKVRHNPTETVKFQLSTEERAHKRADWDKYLKEKEIHREGERQAAEKRKHAEDAETIKRMRAQTVHRALPVPQTRHSVNPVPRAPGHGRSGPSSTSAPDVPHRGQPEFSANADPDASDHSSIGRASKTGSKSGSGTRGR